MGTKMYDNSAQTQKPQKLIKLEEFFPRKFFQNNSAEAVHKSLVVKFKTKRKMLTMVVQVRLCHL